MEIQLKPIGIVHSKLKKLEDCPLLEHEDAPEATVEVFVDFVEGMKDISRGSEVILFTWLHKADRAVLTTHPRNDLNVPLTGVFSTRSPDRPNPVGMHSVTIISITETNKLHVSGLEVLDQTPLVDIKPKLKSIT